MTYIYKIICILINYTVTTQQSNGELCIIDVSITDPTCKSAVAYRSNIGSHNTPLIAARMREESKHAKYKKYLKPDIYVKFQPFVLEDTGRMSKSSQVWFDKVCKLDRLDLTLNNDIKLLRNAFIEKVNIISVAIKAVMARLSRRNCVTNSIY